MDGLSGGRRGLPFRSNSLVSLYRRSVRRYGCYIDTLLLFRFRSRSVLLHGRRHAGRGRGRHVVIGVLTTSICGSFCKLCFKLGEALSSEQVPKDGEEVRTVTEQAPVSDMPPNRQDSNKGDKTDAGLKSVFDLSVNQSWIDRVRRPTRSDALALPRAR